MGERGTGIPLTGHRKVDDGHKYGEQSSGEYAADEKAGHRIEQHEYKQGAKANQQIAAHKLDGGCQRLHYALVAVDDEKGR